MEVDFKICSEVQSLPDGWDLLLHHHVCQVVMMLGQKESLDDRLPDLKGDKKNNNLKHNLTGASMTQLKSTWAMSGFLPSAGIWPPKLGGNPGVP